MNLTILTLLEAVLWPGTLWETPTYAGMPNWKWDETMLSPERVTHVIRYKGETIVVIALAEGPNGYMTGFRKPDFQGQVSTNGNHDLSWGELLNLCREAMYRKDRE